MFPSSRWQRCEFCLSRFRGAIGNLLYVACTRATDRLFLAEALFNELC